MADIVRDMNLLHGGSFITQGVSSAEQLTAGAGHGWNRGRESVLKRRWDSIERAVGAVSVS